MFSNIPFPRCGDPLHLQPESLGHDPSSPVATLVLATRAKAGGGQPRHVASQLGNSEGTGHCSSDQRAFREEKLQLEDPHPGGHDHPAPEKDPDNNTKTNDAEHDNSNSSNNDNIGDVDFRGNSIKR